MKGWNFSMATPFANGMLIVIEGIDGAGKTTQVEALQRAFLTAGEVPVVSKEPTDGPWGLKIKQSATSGRMPLDEELQAFIQDRTEHVRTLILPALSEGRIVILDRYFYSTIAYQGSRGADFLKIESEMKARFPIPDVVFVLDIDPTISIHRIHHSRRDTPNEFEQYEGLRKAREIFANLSGDHVRILDGTLSIPVLHANILDHVIDGPLKSQRCAKSYGCNDPFNCSYRLTNSCRWFTMAKALRLAEESSVGAEKF
jgi:dTMP kinase